MAKVDNSTKGWAGILNSQIGGNQEKNLGDVPHIKNTGGFVFFDGNSVTYPINASQAPDVLKVDRLDRIVKDAPKAFAESGAAVISYAFNPINGTQILVQPESDQEKNPLLQFTYDRLTQKGKNDLISHLTEHNQLVPDGYPIAFVAPSRSNGLGGSSQVNVLERVIFSGDRLPHLHPDPNSAPHLSHDELMKLAGDDNIPSKRDYVNTVKGFLEAVGMREGDTLVLPKSARIHIDKSLPPINRLEMKYGQVLAGTNNMVSIGLLSEAEQKALLRSLVDMDTKRQFDFVPTAKLENPAALKQELDKVVKEPVSKSHARYDDKTGKIEIDSEGFSTGNFYSTPILETRLAEAARHAPLSDSDYAEKELRAEADAKVEKTIHDRFEELMKESEKQDRNQGLKL